MKFQPKTVTGESRVRLGELIAAQKAEAARAAGALEAAKAALSRLQATATAADPIRQQLDALDAAETAEALAAARAGTVTPEADLKRRSDLRRELESAVAREAAAKRAMPEVEAEIARESATKPEFEQAKNALITEIAGAELDALVDEMAATVETLTRQQQVLGDIREAIITKAAEAGGDREAYVRLERLDAKLDKARQRPIVDTSRARAAWAAFLIDLRSDAGAVLAKVSTEAEGPPLDIAEIVRRRELALRSAA